MADSIGHPIILGVRNIYKKRVLNKNIKYSLSKTLNFIIMKKVGRAGFEPAKS